VLSETQLAIQSVRTLKQQHPWLRIALAVGPTVSSSWARSFMGADVVLPLLGADRHSVQDDFKLITGFEDLRVAKLHAYLQSPFNRTIFLDGDTFVRSDGLLLLFKGLGVFELLAAFECCRALWKERPGDHMRVAERHDPLDFFAGWEMQTGVMAYRRTERVRRFWAAALRVYLERPEYWRQRTSGEQGAATLALAQSDVRFMPLPPAFNVRVHTTSRWLPVFGAQVLHRHDLWKRPATPARGEEAKPLVHGINQQVASSLRSEWEASIAVASTNGYRGALHGALSGSSSSTPIQHARRAPAAHQQGAHVRQHSLAGALHERAGVQLQTRESGPE